MTRFFKEFETFAVRGNAVDLAVGVLIGAAFGQVTNSLSTNVLTPIVGLFLGGYDFSKLSISLGGEAIIAYGVFLQAVLNFLLITFSLFLFVKLLNNLSSRRSAEDKKNAPPPKPIESAELQVLKEIRDEIKRTA